jgi:hypothetical protein
VIDLAMVPTGRLINLFLCYFWGICVISECALTGEWK